uniref:BID domain-containing protein n=1 Tax=Sinorhizobium sp. M14 TaxID=430451 RepID=UPI002150439C|nr:BID domain-containing protein [Sinorhizobium sp. M14]
MKIYSRSVEDVARENARPEFDRAMEAVRSVGRNVYADPDGVAGKLSADIVDKGMLGQALATSVTECPEQFGELRGKTGLLGDNKERKAARHYAKALGHHVASAGQTWERRLEAEYQSEMWNREKRDVIEVPGLAPRSEAILKQLDGLSQSEKPKFLEQISGTPEGSHALEEAKKIAQALEQRFGSAEARDLKLENMRLGPELSTKLDRIKDVARIVDRAQRAELTRTYELTRGLKKGLGLGI